MLTGIQRVSLCVTLLGLAVAASWATDPDADKDGYVSIEHGGTDCVDQHSSIFIDGTRACDPSLPPVFIDGPFWISDHCWIEDTTGVYHLFHHASGPLPEILHSTTTDLKSLTSDFPEVALSPTAGAWDSHSLWAPHVVEVNGTYYMFYSGTTGSGSDPRAIQRIGVALSTDLAQWTKYPGNDCAGTTGDGCVYDCDEVWTAWGNGGDYDAQCRDPFVLWDADRNLWVMFVTVRLDVPGSWSEGIGVATSTDLFHWTGAGYIEATKRLTSAEGGTFGQRWGSAAENAFVTKYDGVYYLLFSDWHDEEPENPDCADSTCSMVQYATSLSLAATPTGSQNWVYRGYTPDRGVNAIEVVVRAGDTWVQSQSVANANSGDWLEHGRDLRLKRMVWLPDTSYATSNLTDLACRVPSAQINPGMPEICGDRIDNDCDGRAENVAECRRRRGTWEQVGAGVSSVHPSPLRTQDPEAFLEARRLRIDTDSRAETLRIGYSVGSRSAVRLEVFDVAGRRIRTLVAGVRAPGDYHVTWDWVDSAGTRVARGVYVIRLLVGDAMIARKIVNAR